MASIQPNTINLVRKKEDGTFDVILKFALTGGRFLVLITETIALCAFVYRFSLDRQIIDLRDEITVKQAIATQYSTLENTYRGVQDRLSNTKTISASAPQIPNLFSSILDSGNGELNFTAFLITTESIRLEVNGPSAESLNAFVNTLKENPNLEEVSIDRVENRTSSALINMAISASLKNAKKQDTGNKTNKPADL